MKLKYLLFIAFFSFYGCEETVNDVSLPYVENLVIRSILEVNDSIKVTVSKTLPPLEEFKEEKAAVYDAEVFVIVDNIKLECKRTSNNIYTNPTIVKAGKKYNLEVKWKNKYAYAETVVPEPTSINVVSRKIKQSEWNTENFALVYTAKSLLTSGIAYIPSVETYGKDFLNKIYPYNSIYFLTEQASTQEVNILYPEFFVFDTLNLDSKYNMKVRLRLDCYEKSFIDFYQTQYNGEGSNLFGMSGTNVMWNIKGNGIGMFIGRSYFILDLN